MWLWRQRRKSLKKLNTSKVMHSTTEENSLVCSVRVPKGVGKHGVEGRYYHVTRPITNIWTIKITYPKYLHVTTHTTSSWPVNFTGLIAKGFTTSLVHKPPQVRCKVNIRSPWWQSVDTPHDTITCDLSVGLLTVLSFLKTIWNNEFCDWHSLSGTHFSISLSTSIGFNSIIWPCVSPSEERRCSYDAESANV
jgi:hypothetical protein